MVIVEFSAIEIHRVISALTYNLEDEIHCDFDHSQSHAPIELST
jgi:hypothetical protein